MNAQNFYEKGLECHYLGWYNDAVMLYEKAIDLGLILDNEVADNVGLSYLETNDYDKAIVCFKESINKNIKAYNSLGVAYYRKGNRIKAKEIWETVIGLNPDISIKANAYCSLGYFYHDCKEYDNAIKCYKDALNLKPDFVQACHDLSMVYQDKGDDKEFIEWYKKGQEAYKKQLDEQCNKMYLINAAEPRKTRSGSVYVITELIDSENSEIINIHNFSNCPNFIRLCATYPVFGAGASYQIIEKNDVKTVPNLHGINSEAIVGITNLLDIYKEEVFQVVPWGHLLCELSLMRECHWV